MTILAENLKSIRKRLNCTQMAISDVLDIGFRTYVRYEAGERDAPVSVLIKIAKLGNITLDRLLTTKLSTDGLKLSDQETLPVKADNAEVVSGSIKEGRLTFKGIKEDFCVTTSVAERKLLSHFRKLNTSSQKKCIKDLETVIEASNNSNDYQLKVSKKSQKVKNTKKLKKMAKSIKKITVKG